MWEMEKLLVTSNFSFSHSVFKRLVSQGLQKVSLCGNGLMIFKQEICLSWGRKLSWGDGKSSGFHYFSFSWNVFWGFLSQGCSIWWLCGKRLKSWCGKVSGTSNFIFANHLFNLLLLIHSFCPTQWYYYALIIYFSKGKSIVGKGQNAS